MLLPHLIDIGVTVLSSERAWKTAHSPAVNYANTVCNIESCTTARH